MIIVGTDIKVNVHIDPIYGQTMDSMDFECFFYSQSTCVYERFKKNDMIRVDENNYIACIHTHKLGRGTLCLKIVATVVDTDFENGVRNEVLNIKTDIQISNI